MESPRSPNKKSAVLSIVLEEITDDDDDGGEDAVDGAAGSDGHDGLVQSALKRQGGASTIALKKGRKSIC